MKHSMNLRPVKSVNQGLGTRLLWICGTSVVALFVLSLFVGQYPLTWQALWTGEETAWRVLLNLRLARAIMAVLAGFSLSFAGYVYQSLLKNPIAAPDVIGVSSGACVGSGISIVFLGGGVVTTAVLAFSGGLLAVLFTSLLASVSSASRIANLVLSGIAVNALAQAVLMMIKRAADPENQLASLEYWTMGSLSAITLQKVMTIGLFVVISLVLLYLLFRQITILSLDSDMSLMLGVNVGQVRMGVMIIATVAVGAVVSVTGLITFIGLMAPHIARLLHRKNDKSTLLLSGMIGAMLLLCADMIARSLYTSELPISVVTSLLGVPFLISLVIKGER